MNEEQLLRSIQLPKSTHVLRTFPYNKLEPKLSGARKIVSENVVSRGIRLLSIISPNNANIQIFEDETERFEEIHFIVSMLIISEKQLRCIKYLQTSCRTRL